MKRPLPALYCLRREFDGTVWYVEAVQRQAGNPTRHVLMFPHHDAYRLRDMLNSLYNESWEVVLVED